MIGLALLAEFIWLSGHVLFGWGHRDYAATPQPLIYRAPAPPSGRDVLLQLAAVAARPHAGQAGARAPYAYVKRQEWRLPGEISGAPVPSQVESWREPDGGGRILSVTRKLTGSTVDDAKVPPGHPLPALSTSETVLARRFAFGAPMSGASARQFVELTNLAGTQPIAPLVEAAILRLVARIPGLVNSGTVIDRDGRAGVAVSLASAYTGALISYTLIFDQSTGALLEADQTLAGNPGRLNVRPGSVLAYTTFLAWGYVADTATRPPTPAPP